MLDARPMQRFLELTQPMPYDVRPMQNQPAGRLSEFPA